MSEKLDNLAFRFFKLFAQYESSLKEMQFFNSSDGRVSVDWDRFANEKIGTDFLEELGEAAPSAVYILNDPPKKQGVDEHRRIIWLEGSNNEKSVQILFSYIRRIRNNLYHGAKFNGTWFDPDRSQLLLEHGLNVLQKFQHKVDVY